MGLKGETHSYLCGICMLDDILETLLYHPKEYQLFLIFGLQLIADAGNLYLENPYFIYADRFLQHRVV